MRYAALLLACLLLAACGSAPRPATFNQVTIEYTLAQAQALPQAVRVPLTERSGYLMVQGSVDGQYVGPMMLDTGSTLNIIDRGITNRLRLPQIGEGQTIGIAGAQGFTWHSVDSLAIGSLDLGVDRAGSLSMYRLTRGAQMNPSGLIGSVSLMPHPFTIDYSRSELIVYNRAGFTPPTDCDRVELAFFGRLPAVHATLADGTEVLLIIDTGADNSISLPIELASHPGVLATGSTGGGVSRGIGGEIRTIQGWLSNINLFGRNLAHVEVTFEPQSFDTSRSSLPVGRIGGELLRGFRLTFDARQRALWVRFAQPTAQ